MNLTPLIITYTETNAPATANTPVTTSVKLTAEVKSLKPAADAEAEAKATTETKATLEELFKRDKLNIFKHLLKLKKKTIFFQNRKNCTTKLKY